MAGLIETAWRSYAERLVPASAPDIYRMAFRHAFYMGALALFSGVIASTDDYTEEIAESDLALFDGVKGELDRFLRDGAQGIL